MSPCLPAAQFYKTRVNRRRSTREEEAAYSFEEEKTSRGTDTRQDIGWAHPCEHSFYIEEEEYRKGEGKGRRKEGCLPRKPPLQSGEMKE